MPTSTFVEAEFYDAVEVLGRERFDLVYTGVGALCWLPDIRRWGGVVADLLRPGGRFFMREGHPVMWGLEDGREDHLLVLEHSYFERPEPALWDEGGTYVETDVDVHPHPQPGVEPRPRRDRVRPDSTPA